MEKIKQSPITVCKSLEDYPGDPEDPEESADFIIDTFLAKNTTEKTIHPHLTCATDRTNVNLVFDSVKETVMKKSLEAAGLTTAGF